MINKESAHLNLCYSQVILLCWQICISLYWCCWEVESSFHLRFENVAWKYGLSCIKCIRDGCMIHHWDQNIIVRKLVWHLMIAPPSLTVENWMLMFFTLNNFALAQWNLGDLHPAGNSTNLSAACRSNSEVELQFLAETTCLATWCHFHPAPEPASISQAIRQNKSIITWQIWTIPWQMSMITWRRTRTMVR